MKNTKNAWKLFFTMMIFLVLKKPEQVWIVPTLNIILKQNRLIWVSVSAILIIMGILMLVLVGVEGEMMGDEEHLLSASFTGFGYYLNFFADS